MNHFARGKAAPAARPPAGHRAVPADAPHDAICAPAEPGDGGTRPTEPAPAGPGGGTRPTAQRGPSTGAPTGDGQ
ncbi:hypothetical protein [Streptomyces sp. SAI-041]|uniref:hypothetical protein n=1 Tax=Streptomyces sp. SAI-041 TaxID=2940548 RepID=UPI002475A00B|nr:hypothetical protein [Streptomyces sp. SAI-041]MDH6551209.1 hypothetical protein [Streptomyces sp. SAI-041]